MVRLLFGCSDFLLKTVWVVCLLTNWTKALDACAVGAEALMVAGSGDGVQWLSQGSVAAVQGTGDGGVGAAVARQGVGDGGAGTTVA